MPWNAHRFIFTLKSCRGQDAHSDIIAPPGKLDSSRRSEGLPPIKPVRHHCLLIFSHRQGHLEFSEESDFHSIRNVIKRLSLPILQVEWKYSNMATGKWRFKIEISEKWLNKRWILSYSTGFIKVEKFTEK